MKQKNKDIGILGKFLYGCIIFLGGTASPWNIIDIQSGFNDFQGIFPRRKDYMFDIRLRPAPILQLSYQSIELWTKITVRSVCQANRRKYLPSIPSCLWHVQRASPDLRVQCCSQQDWALSWIRVHPYLPLWSRPIFPQVGGPCRWFSVQHHPSRHGDGRLDRQCCVTESIIFYSKTHRARNMYWLETAQYIWISGCSLYANKVISRHQQHVHLQTGRNKWDIRLPSVPFEQIEANKGKKIVSLDLAPEE